MSDRQTDGSCCRRSLVNYIATSSDLLQLPVQLFITPPADVRIYIKLFILLIKPNEVWMLLALSLSRLGTFSAEANHTVLIDTHYVTALPQTDSHTE